MDEGRSPDDFAETLKENDVDVLWEPALHSQSEHGDGTWGGNYSVYINDPDGHIVEVYSGMDEFIGNIQAV